VGKSTVAARLADRLGWVYLDTGAMYRAVTWAVLNRGADVTSAEAVLQVMDEAAFVFEPASGVLRVRVDGADVTEAIRDPRLTAQVRHVAAMPEVRQRLVAMQQAFADRHGPIIAEGRDQGTVAFPEAVCKFFVTAETTERARRRQKQLEQAGRSVPLETLIEQIEQRDAADRQRSVGPLRPADGAIVVDTTHMGIDEVVETLYETVRARLSAGG